MIVGFCGAGKSTLSFKFAGHFIFPYFKELIGFYGKIDYDIDDLEHWMRKIHRMIC